MSSRVNVENDDGQWRFVPNIGKVRAAPRTRPPQVRLSSRRSVAQENRLGRRSSIEKVESSGGGLVSDEQSVHWKTSLAHRFARNQKQRVDKEGVTRQNIQAGQEQFQIRHRSDRSRSPDRGRSLDEINSEIHHHQIRLRSLSGGRSLDNTHSEDSLFIPERSLRSITEQHTNEHEPIFRSLPPTWMLRSPKPSAECVCPVNTRCPWRADNQLDCRTLVVEWNTWRTRDLEDLTLTVIRAGHGTAGVVSEQRLMDIKLYCDHVENTPALSRSHHHNFKRMIDWIQEMREVDLTDEIVTRSGILPRLGNYLSEDNRPNLTSKRVLTFITEDLTVLFRKWERGDLGCYPNRGLLVVTKKADNGQISGPRFRLDKSWPFYMRADFFGEGHLANGQMSWSRLQMQRDGIHAASIAGISGNIKEGAYSVVMGYHNDSTREYYADVDNGNSVWYQGTALAREEGDTMPSNIREADWENNEVAENDESSDHRVTQCTQMLMTSIRTQNPVRLIRSHNLAPVVNNRPLIGYRYDGLYLVKKKALLHDKRQIWSFLLERIEGQGPLRGVPRSGPPRSPLPVREGRRPRR